jgi:hypothetical protein
MLQTQLFGIWRFMIGWLAVDVSKALYWRHLKSQAVHEEQSCYPWRPRHCNPYKRRKHLAQWQGQLVFTAYKCIDNVWAQFWFHWMLKASHFAVKTCCADHHEAYIVTLKSSHTDLSRSFNLLKSTGYVMHKKFNIQQFQALPTLYLCVLCLSEN